MKRNHINLSAYWGDGAAESTIDVSLRRWKSICEGAEYSTSADAWYEGESFTVQWKFKNGMFSIYGSDEMGDHIYDSPVEELIVQSD